jgi:hypothetical protein
VRICHKCESTVNDDHNFCMKCGILIVAPVTGTKLGSSESDELKSIRGEILEATQLLESLHRKHQVAINREREVAAFVEARQKLETEAAELKVRLDEIQAKQKLYSSEKFEEIAHVADSPGENPFMALSVTDRLLRLEKSRERPRLRNREREARRKTPKQEDDRLINPIHIDSLTEWAKLEHNANVLGALAADDVPKVRAAVAANQETTGKVLNLFLHDSSIEVRIAAAANRNCPAYVLKSFSEDIMMRVRLAVAENLNTPDRIRMILALDTNENVKKMATDSMKL